MKIVCVCVRVRVRVRVCVSGFRYVYFFWLEIWCILAFQVSLLSRILELSMYMKTSHCPSQLASQKGKMSEYKLYSLQLVSLLIFLQSSIMPCK